MITNRRHYTSMPIKLPKSRQPTAVHFSQSENRDAFAAGLGRRTLLLAERAITRRTGQKGLGARTGAGLGAEGSRNQRIECQSPAHNGTNCF